MIPLEKITNDSVLPFKKFEIPFPRMNLLKSFFEMLTSTKDHILKEKKVHREFSYKDNRSAQKHLALNKTPMKSHSRSFSASKLEKYLRKMTLSDPRSKAFLNHLNSYISEMEHLTNVKISENQKNQLILYAKNNPLAHLTKDEKNQARKEYNTKRSSMIQDWEINTGKKWPIASDFLKTTSGKLLTNKPARHQLHHIILISFGGPNVWWNAHPASNDAHKKIHHKTSVSNLIFPIKPTSCPL